MRRYVVSLVFAGCAAAAAPLAAQPAMHDETSAATQPAPPAMAVQQVPEGRNLSQVCFYPGKYPEQERVERDGQKRPRQE